MTCNWSKFDQCCLNQFCRGCVLIRIVGPVKYIYLIKNIVKTVILWNITTILNVFSMWIYCKMSFIPVIKAVFSVSLLQSSVPHDPSEIILICWFETFLIISNVENCFCQRIKKGNCVFLSQYSDFTSSIFFCHRIQINKMFLWFYLLFWLTIQSFFPCNFDFISHNPYFKLTSLNVALYLTILLQSSRNFILQFIFSYRFLAIDISKFWLYQFWLSEKT